MALFYLFCILSFVEERGAPDVSYRSAYLMRIVCGCYLVLVFLSMFNGMLFQVAAVHLVSGTGAFNVYPGDSPYVYVVLLGNGKKSCGE